MELRSKKTLKILLLIAAVLLVVRFIVFNTVKIMYPGFGITLPMGYQLHGIDVSRYQKKIDWSDVADMQVMGVKMNFAFIKATEGTSIVDGKYSQNYKNAKQTKLVIGSYHYFHPNISGIAQANYYVQYSHLQSGDFCPVIDIEETDNVSDAKLQTELRNCLTALENKYGCKPIIYSNAKFYDAHLGDKFLDYPLWVAHYDVVKPNCSRPWQIWQHSDKGNVNGIDAKVDFNVINGGQSTLKTLLIP